jgi:hypothetical protein
MAPLTVVLPPFKNAFTTGTSRRADASSLPDLNVSGKLALRITVGFPLIIMGGALPLADVVVR